MCIRDRMCRDGAKIQKFSEILTSEVCVFSNFAILKVEHNKSVSYTHLGYKMERISPYPRRSHGRMGEDE